MYGKIKWLAFYRAVFMLVSMFSRESKGTITNKFPNGV